MAWLSVSEYAKWKKLTEAAVYKQIKQDKLITKKGEHNKTLIQTKLSDNHILYGQSNQIHESTELIDSSNKEDLERLERFFNGLVEELKISKTNEINTLKESYDRILQMKDQQVDKQSQELKALKEEIEKIKGKGFFKRIFGG